MTMMIAWKLFCKLFFLYKFFNNENEKKMKSIFLILEKIQFCFCWKKDVIVKCEQHTHREKEKNRYPIKFGYIHINRSIDSQFSFSLIPTTNIYSPCFLMTMSQIYLFLAIFFFSFLVYVIGEEKYRIEKIDQFWSIDRSSKNKWTVYLCVCGACRKSMLASIQ